MKKKIITITTIFVCAFALVITLVFTLQNDNEPIFNYSGTAGVWCWDENISHDYIDMAAKNNIDEIYFCSESFGDETVSFITKAKEKNIKVYWLYGGACLDNWALFHTEMNKYIEYNINHPESAFEGVHLDVEPHGHDNYNQDKQGYIESFAVFVKSMKTIYPSHTFDVDIPFWLDNIITYGGVTKEAYKFIFDNADRVFVMSYRDKAEDILDISKQELAYAKQVSKPIFLCVETADLGANNSNVTFFEEGKEYMYNEIYKLKTLTADEFGISIHYLTTWHKLKV